MNWEFDEMAIFRINHTKDYTVLSNRHFREKAMSLKAKGLLSLMLSLPDDWDYSINGLSVLSKDGKASVSEGLKELESLGYLQRHRSFINSKFSGWIYDIYEIPYTDFLNTENQYTENQDTENPNTENQPQLNTKKPITKESKTKEPITQQRYFDDPEVNETFLALIADRKERKKPMTSRAKEMAAKKVNELSKGDNALAIKIINQSIEKGWSGIFPYKETNLKQTTDDCPKSIHDLWSEAGRSENE